jgi:hypothetical protein
VRFNGRGLPPDLAATEIIALVNHTGRKQIALNRLGKMEGS